MWHSRFTQDKLGCANLLQKKIQYFTKKNITEGFPFNLKFPTTLPPRQVILFIWNFWGLLQLLKWTLHCSGVQPLITGIHKHSFLLHKRSSRRKHHLSQNKEKTIPYSEKTAQQRLQAGLERKSCRDSSTGDFIGASLYPLYLSQGQGISGVEGDFLFSFSGFFSLTWMRVKGKKKNPLIQQFKWTWWGEDIIFSPDTFKYSDT